MGKSLYWAPKPVEPKIYSIGYMEDTFAEYVYKYGCVDKRIVGKGLIPFLEAMALTAGTETSRNARELINAIKQYGEVEIFFKG